MPPCGSLYRISVSFIKVVIIIMQAFSVKLKFHVFCCKTSIFFCVYLHCDGHCLYFCSLFIISCLFSAKSFTYCSYPLYNFLRRMLYNKITAREQEPDAVNLLITPSITVNTLTSLLPLSQRKSPGAVMKTVPGLFLYYMYYWMRTSKTVSSSRLARISRPNSSFLRVKCSRSPS